MSSRVELWLSPSGRSSSFNNVFTHTSICVVFEEDFKYLFSYNENGYSSYRVTDRMRPISILIVGTTSKSLPEIVEYLQHLCNTTFKYYAAYGRSCNYFSNVLSYWLCGKEILKDYVYQDVFAAFPLIRTSVLAGIYPEALLPPRLPTLNIFGL